MAEERDSLRNIGDSMSSNGGLTADDDDDTASERLDD